jgi:CubicO group peptidase (beta-lactamase class C family)
MKRTKGLLLLIASILLTQITYAQDRDWDKLRTYFNTLEENDKFMGSVAIWNEGELAFTHAVGYADVENEVPLTTESRFRVGSISKTFTATLIFMAVEEGKLSLDQTVDSFFPDLQKADSITIAMLVGHRSGIHNITNDPEYFDYNTQPQTRERMLEIVVEAGSDFSPGSKAQYSNSNYLLLTFILEDTYGRPFDVLLEEKITKPIGLDETYIGSAIDMSQNECYSYSYDGNWNKEEETNMSIPLGAGAVVSTPTELVEFIRALFAGKLVNEQSLNQMKDIKDRYGMGLFSFPFGNKTSYGHTGGIDGFSSVFGYFPEEDIAFAMTSNGVNYNPNEISIAVLSEVFGEEYEIPEFIEVEISEEILDSYVGTYTSPDLPLDLTVTREGKTLIAQGTGQSPFTLDAVSTTKFEYKMAGIELEFFPEKNEMILKQGGGSFLFTKK